jgi:hypothetical protein
MKTEVRRLASIYLAKGHKNACGSGTPGEHQQRIPATVFRRILCPGLNVARKGLIARKREIKIVTYGHTELLAEFRRLNPNRRRRYGHRPRNCRFTQNFELAA